MTKDEYLRELAARLSRLPQGEQDDAVSFYREYFDDAGNEQEAADALGPPSKLAAQINAEYSARMLEEGVSGGAPADEKKAGQDASQAAPAQAPPSGHSKDTGAPAGSSLTWIWLVILGIFALPVALPVALAAILTVVSIILACVAVVAALVVSVVYLVAFGASVAFTSGAALTGADSLMVIGSAIAVLGLTLVLIPLVVRFCVWLVALIGKLTASIFNRLKRRSAQK
jgi:uncharacterized membrane protein